MAATNLSTRRDVVTRVRRQHETIRGLFDDVEAASPARRAEAFQPLVRLLAVHETAEEMVVYPALLLAGSDARAVVQARKVEEDQAKKHLAELEGLTPVHATFSPNSVRSVTRWKRTLKRRKPKSFRCSMNIGRRTSCVSWISGLSWRRRWRQRTPIASRLKAPPATCCSARPWRWSTGFGTYSGRRRLPAAGASAVFH